MTDPTQMTPLERNWDEVLRFENARRYTEQSSATVSGRAAPLPPREPGKEAA